MSKYILLIFLVIFSINISTAHQADISSTMLIEREDGSWIFQLRAALTAFEYEIKNHYGENSYDSPEAFQELVINHLKENIAIQFNDKDSVSFQNGFVKLGHETNAVFQVSGVPKTWKTVTIKNSSFKNINRNKSALIIFKNGFNKDQFILNNQNNHTFKLKIKDSKFIPLTKEQQANSWILPTIISVSVLLFISLLFLLWKRRQKVKQV